MIDQLTVDKIIDTAQIVDVVQEFVTLRRRGQNYVGLCPFHADKSPSFYVNPNKNVCKCFACGEGGSPVTFLMKKEQMTFPEAIKWLADKYHIEVQDKKMSDEDRRRQTDREGMFQVNEFAQKCFEEDLFNTPEGRNVGLTYFRERGIQDETIHRYHLGYALEDKLNLANRAIQHGLSRDYLLDGTGVGLCFGDDPKKVPVCRFAGRVIFPHHSLSGKCIAFGGRILQRVDHAFKKYVNSPESLIYHKSDLPYGLFEAKGAMAKENMCYVVEGNIDVLSMSQAGFQNVIAASGTALTSEHIRIIKRFTSNCTLMFDADNAGITAALKSIDLLILEGMKVKLLLLPEGEDPDSFCRHHSSDEVRQYFEANQQDFITFKANMLMRGVNPNDPIALAQVVQNLANSVTLVADPIFSSILVRQISQRMNVREQEVLNAVNIGKQNNYMAEVRRQEIEMRRQESLREREELGIKATDVQPAVGAAESAQTGNVPSGNGWAGNGQTSNVPSSADQTMNSSAGFSPARVSLYSDRFERNIIRYIVRYGGQTFAFSYSDPETLQTITENWRVIDFIFSELNADQVILQHPLYARMFQMALDASADPAVEWDSVRFFCNLMQDPEAQNLAFDLLQDKYDAMGIAHNEEQLEVLIPRCVLELKNALLTMQIRDITSRLRHPSPTDDLRSLMEELANLKKIQTLFDKELGERVVIG